MGAATGASETGPTPARPAADASATPRGSATHPGAGAGAGTDRPRRRIVGTVAAITVVAAAFDLYRLGARSLWSDEGFTVGLVRMPYGDFLARIWRFEVNQSPYYLLFDLWHHLGEAEATMRLLSAGFGIATVPVVFLLGRRLHDERVGVTAAALVALNGLVVQWSQQLRSYSMVLFLVALASLLLVRAVDRPSTRSALAYALVAVLAVYTNFFAVLVLVAHGLTLLPVRPFPRRLVLISTAVLVVPLVRIAVYVRSARTDPLGWIARPSGLDLVRNVADIAGGSALQLAVYAVVVAAGIVLVARAVRADPRSVATWRSTMPLAWLVVPVVAVVVSTYLAKPLFVPRYLIVVVPALAIVAATALARFPQRQVAKAAAVVLVAVSLVGVAASYGEESSEDWRALTASVAGDVADGDVVAVVPSQSEPTFTYYVRRMGRADVTTVAPDAGDPPADGRLWEVRRIVGEGPPPEPPFWDPMHDYADWRDRHYVVAGERAEGRLVVRLFQRR